VRVGFKDSCFVLQYRFSFCKLWFCVVINFFSFVYAKERTIRTKTCILLIFSIDTDTLRRAVDAFACATLEKV